MNAIFVKKTYNLNKLFNIHVRKHTGESTHECGQCKKHSLPNIILLNTCEHTQGATCTNVIVLTLFSNTSDYTRTIIMYIDEKPLLCKYCDKSFSNYDNEAIHLRTHSGDKPYSFSICDNNFLNKSNLLNLK